MQDLHVVKLHYAYQVRLDLPHTSISECLIEKWMDKYHVVNYLFGREIKPKDKTPHYQGIVWFETKLSDARHTVIRNWWRKKTLATFGPKGKKVQGHSFTSAYKIRNLGKYCQKEGNFYTNLSSHQIECIGKWKTIDALKAEKSEKLAKKLKIHVVTPMNFHDFLHIFDKIYWEIYDTNPTRSMVLKWARKTNIMSRTKFYEMMFPSYFRNYGVYHEIDIDEEVIELKYKNEVYQKGDIASFSVSSSEGEGDTI